MEESAAAVESVKNLPTDGKRALEKILGQKLEDNQQIFIMVLSPGKEPGAEARRQARAGMEATFQKTDSYAREHGISDEEVDAAIEQAMDHVRPRKD